MSDLSIVLRSLRARSFSTAVTALMVAVAVGLLLTLLSLRSEGTRAFTRGSGNAHLLVSAESSPLVSVLNAIFYANAPQRAIPHEKFVEVRDSFPWTWVVPIQQGDSYRGFPTLATTPEFFGKFEPVEGEPWRFAAGRAFERPFEIVLGAEAARETRLNLDARIVLTHGAGAGAEHGHEHRLHEFTVVGILEPTGSAHDRALFSDLESSWILHAEDRHERAAHEAGGAHDHDGDEKPLTVADLTDEDRKVTGILLRVPTPERFSISSAIPAQFDRLRRDPTITVANPADQISRLLAIVGKVDVLFLAVALVVLVASAISILLALYNSMYERRRQVAVFRVLGCSRPRVFALVLTESALIGLTGAIVGVALALVGGALASGWLAETRGVVIRPGVDPRAAILVVAATVALACIAGLLPAILAYRTPVADHLRPTA